MFQVRLYSWGETLLEAAKFAWSSVCLSVCVSVCLSFCLSVYVCLCVCCNHPSSVNKISKCLTLSLPWETSAICFWGQTVTVRVCKSKPLRAVSSKMSSNKWANFYLKYFPPVEDLMLLFMVLSGCQIQLICPKMWPSWKSQWKTHDLVQRTSWLAIHRCLLKENKDSLCHRRFLCLLVSLVSWLLSGLSSPVEISVCCANAYWCKTKMEILTWNEIKSAMPLWNTSRWMCFCSCGKANNQWGVKQRVWLISIATTVKTHSPS